MEDEGNGEPPISYPRDPKHYEILEIIGSSPEAVMYKAKYVSYDNNEVILQIKVVDTYGYRDICRLTSAIQLAKYCNHKNLVRVHSSFKSGDKLWLVMPLMSGVSLKSLIFSSFHRGLPEALVGFILKETLTILDCVHSHGGFHQNLDCDHIFVDKHFRVKLVFDSLLCNVQQSCSDLLIAPELVLNPKERGRMNDIWQFGVLALELTFGPISASNYKSFETWAMQFVASAGASDKSTKQEGLIRKILGSCLAPHMEDVTGKKLSNSLKEVVCLCLSLNPSKRPTTKQLLDHRFFKELHVRDSCLKELTRQLNKQ